MNDDLLFASAPYIAACAMLVAAAHRFLAPSDQAVDRLRRPDNGAPVVRMVAGGASLALAALHAVLLSAPEAVLGWNSNGRRRVALESAGILIGAVCLIALGRMIWRHRPSGPDHGTAIGDVVMSTLLGIAIVSGLMIAILYPWASSWSVVTLTPYAISLMNVNPRVELVASMPFLVRLHVFCTFAIFVAIPFTRVGSTALVWMRRVAATAAMPVTRTSRLLGAAAGEWTRRLLRPLVSSNDERS